jgi:antitoxin component YwqK of YwqJK toxin-antitoxin module
MKQNQILTLLAICIVVLIGCSHDNYTKNGVKEVLKSKDNNTQFILSYGENGKVKSIIMTNTDSTQSVKVVFDTTGAVRATVLEKGRKRTHATEYYKNGRPMGLTNFDSTWTGDAIYYYENGNKRSEGHWTNDKQTGIWKNYNNKGELTKIDSSK